MLQLLFLDFNPTKIIITIIIKEEQKNKNK
jgi:hypothetical protein